MMQSRLENDVPHHCQRCNMDLFTDTPVIYMTDIHTNDKPSLHCVLCEVIFDAATNPTRQPTQAPCGGGLRLDCGHSTCSHKFDDRSKGARHETEHTPTSEEQPPRNKCAHDKIQAVNLNENRSGVSPSKHGLRHLLGSQSNQTDEVALEAYLQSIRDDPVALVELLKSDYLGFQLGVEPFVAALESGRSKPLRSLRNDASMPQLFHLNAAELDLDPDDVSGAAITGLGKSTIYQGHNNKAPIPYRKKHVAEFIGWNVEGVPKCAMNIPLPQFSLHPPPEIAASYHAHESPNTDAYAVSANLSMRGAVVDIHEDRGTLGIAAMDNHQMKLWMLYPAQGNRRVFEKESAVSQRFARCEKALINGRFVITLPGEIITLPPGWLHATLTINRGVLFGSTLIVAEGASAAAQSYKHDIIAQEIVTFGDLNPLVCSLLQAFMAELDDQWQEALTYLCWSSVPRFRNNQGKSTIKDVINVMRSVVMNQKHKACKRCGVDLLEHFPLNIGDEHGRAPKRRKLDS